MGGTSPYTYQWERGTAIGGPYTSITGATGLTLNDTGLSSDTDYYYVLVVTDSASATATSAEIHVKTEAVFPFTFSDNFDSLTAGNINGQNGWATGGNGTWTIGTGGLGGRNIVSQTDSSGSNNFYLNYIANGNNTWTNQRLKVDFYTQSLAYSPQFWLRKTTATGDAGGYLIFYHTDTGVWTIASY